MSAIPESFVRKTTAVSAEVTRPFPNSGKRYIQGSRPDVRVPLREVSQSPTMTSGMPEENPPIPVYDTSGPYTDPEATIDLTRGLADRRGAWINERGDTEWLDGPSSNVWARARP